MGEEQHLIIYRFEDEPRLMVLDFTDAMQFLCENEELLNFLTAEEAKTQDLDLMTFPVNTAVYMKGTIQ